MQVFIPVIGLSMALCGPVWAETLTKTIDERGAVHFGTTEFPNKCCYCHVVIEQTTLGYITESGQPIYVGAKQYFVNGSDGQTWVCPTIGANDSEVVLPSCVVTSGTS